MLPVFKGMLSVSCETWSCFVNSLTFVHEFCNQIFSYKFTNCQVCWFFTFFLPCPNEERSIALRQFSPTEKKSGSERTGSWEKWNRSSRFMCLRLPPCQTQPCYVSTRSFTHFQSDSWIFRLGRIAACNNMQVNRGCNLICGQNISIAFSWMSDVR